MKCPPLDKLHPTSNAAFTLLCLTSLMQYVAYRFDFSLEQIAVHLHDDSKELLSLAVQKTAVKFEGRPSAGGIKLVLHLLCL